MQIQKYKNTNQWAAHTLVWLLDCWPENTKMKIQVYANTKIQIQKYRNTWQYLTTDLKTQTLKYMYMQIQKYRNTNQWAVHTDWSDSLTADLLTPIWPLINHCPQCWYLPIMELNEKEYINKYHPKCVPSAGTSQNKKEYKYKHHPKCVPLHLNQVPPGMGLTGPSKSVPTLNHTGCFSSSSYGHHWWNINLWCKSDSTVLLEQLDNRMAKSKQQRLGPRLWGHGYAPSYDNLSCVNHPEGSVQKFIRNPALENTCYVPINRLCLQQWL